MVWVETLCRRDPSPVSSMGLGRYAAPRSGLRILAWSLHRFLRPDQDRALHNHPWGRSVSFVLSGAYLEEHFGAGGLTSTERRAPAVNVIHRDDYHRIADLYGRVWTLFIAGRKVGGWGYRDRLTGEYREHE